MPVSIKPDVIDVSVHNSVEDWSAVKSFGVKGIIHKATQGTGFVDKRYTERRLAARRVGLLWGAYHFFDRSPPDQQAKNFLRVAQADAETLLCLDWEPYGGNTGTLAQAKEFLRILYEETGQRPVLYSGNLVKEQGRGDPFLAQHRLWLAQYASHPQIPRGWDTYWLWQYSGDGWGGHGTIPGISTRGMDVNLFGGKDLAAEWTGRPQDRKQTPATEPPAEVAAAQTATGAVAVQTDTADTSAPGFMSKLTVATTNTAAINDLADQGSRLAQFIRSAKQWFWRGAATATTTATVASQTVDPNKGNAAVISTWVHQHPLWFALILGLVLGVTIWLVLKRCEKWLVTAYNSGRYDPKKSEV